MGANAFDNISPLLNYQPIPYQAIQQSAQRMQDVSDDAFKQAGALGDIEADVLSADVAERNAILERAEAAQSKIYDLYKSDPRQALEEARRQGTALNKELTRGRLKTMMDNKAAATANMAAIDKQYAAGEITAQDAEQAKQIAMNRYKGIGQKTEFGTYAAFDPFKVSFIEEQLADQGSAFAKGWKSDKYPLGLTKTSYGYINNSNKELVDQNEVYSAITRHLKSKPGNVQYAKQQADFAFAGVDPNTPGLAQQKEQFIDNMFAQAAAPTSDREAFTKVDRSLNKDWQKAMYMQDAVDNPVIPDAHVRHGTGTATEDSIPKFYKDMSFDKYGNPKADVEISADRMPYPSVPEANLTDSQRQEQNKARAEARRENVIAKGREIYNKGKEFGIDIKGKTPQQVNDIIKKAHMDYGAKSTTSRIIQDPASAKSMGSILANNLGSATFYITEPGSGKVMNEDGDFDTVASELMGAWGGATAGQEADALSLIEEVLRGPGQTGWDSKGNPYFEVTDDNGKKRMISMSGTTEVEPYVKPYKILSEARDNHQPVVHYDPDNGLVMTYHPTIKANGKFSDEIIVTMTDDGQPLPEGVHPTSPEGQLYYSKQRVATKDFNWLQNVTEETLKDKDLQRVRKVTKSPITSYTDD